ncbi:MAG: hypothetical protein OEW39_07705 [Deltaproteobacteria bacterium]|nr:hypothetical protein [Deltaproteobacteria bacterium]
MSGDGAMLGEPSRRLTGLIALMCLGWGLGSLGALRAAPLDELARIPVGVEPLGITATRQGDILVVVAAASTVLRIDGQQLTIAAKLDLSQYGRLNRVLSHPETDDVFVTASVQGAVLRLGKGLDQVTGIARVGGFPQGMALLGPNLLVALTAGQALALLEPIGMVALKAVDAGDRPTLVRHDTVNRRILVLKSTTRSIWVFDPKTLSHTGTISNPNLVRLADMAVGPKGEILVLDTSNDNLMILKADGTGLENTISLSAGSCTTCEAHYPMALSIHPSGTKAVVAGRSGRVSLLDLKNGTLLAEKPVGQDLRGICWGAENRVFVTSFATGEVVVLEGLR